MSKEHLLLCLQYCLSDGSLDIFISLDNNHKHILRKAKSWLPGNEIKISV